MVLVLLWEEAEVYVGRADVAGIRVKRTPEIGVLVREATGKANYNLLTELIGLADGRPP